MAHHTATLKDIKRNADRRDRNIQTKSRVKTSIRKLEEAITASDKPLAKECLRNVQSELMIAVRKGTLKKLSSSRKISRLDKRVKAIA